MYAPRFHTPVEVSVSAALDGEQTGLIPRVRIVSPCHPIEPVTK